MSFSQFHNQLVVKPFNQIKKWSAPLKEALDIDYFSYQRVDANGKFIAFANHPAYVEHYLENKFFNFDSFLVHPSNYTTSFYIHPIQEAFFEESHPIFELLRQCKEKFSLHQALLLTYRREDFYETFCFSTQTTSVKGLYRLVSEVELLKTFANFIQPKLSKMVSKSDLGQYAVNMASIKGSAFFPKAPPPDYFLSPERKEPLLKEYTPSVYEWKRRFKLLTAREKECLEFMIEGNSAAVTALLLGRSQRTIEQHLAQAKKKLGTLNQTQTAYLLGKHSSL